MYFIHVPETEKAEQQKVRATALGNVNVQLCCQKVSTGEEIVEFASLAEGEYGRL